METDEVARQHIDKIRQRWRLSARLQNLRLLGMGALLVVSFSLGYAYGPSPIRPLEVGGVMLLILFVLWPIGQRLARRHRVRSAHSALWFREGELSKQALLYDGYIMLENEVILSDSIEQVRREADRIIFRYRDPIAEGPRLRELIGHPKGLDEMVQMLAPKN